MPDRTEYAPGIPNWVDLQTSDQSAAKRFYTELFGWSYEDAPMGDDAVYSMAQLNGKQAAAIAPLPPQQGIPPHWNTYVATADVDATTARATDAGGTLLMPAMDVMDAGRMSVVADPTGAPIALWQAKNNIGASVVNEPGAFTWNELQTPDPEAAAAFFAKLIGWKSEYDEGLDYTVFSVGDSPVAGAMKPPMPGVPPNWLVYFEVADTDDTVAKAQAGGGSVLAEPMDIPPGRFAVLADPQGAVFGVIKSNPM
jgi:predicted enzyme related to lactoylglutathione lyase